MGILLNYYGGEEAESEGKALDLQVDLCLMAMSIK